MRALPSLPPSQIASIGADRVEFILAGSGSPAIVLINGFGVPLAGWSRIFLGCAQLSTTLAYNRPGIGRSSVATRPQTGAEMVTSLLRLLAMTGVSGPYLLLGHSYGGLVADLMARQHPELVAGVVMLDASTAADLRVLPDLESRPQRFLTRLRSRPLDELSSSEATAEQLGAAPAFPPVPLTVITGARPGPTRLCPRAWRAARAQHQRDLAGLSPFGEQVMAPASGHYPQLRDPELVLESVRALLAQRNGNTDAV